MSKTKIIATLGPACANESMLRKMAAAGMHIARINFSHGTLEEHKKQIQAVRRINQKYGHAVKILQDLEGHRIRVGELKDHRPVPLKKRQLIELTTEHVTGDATLIPIDYRGSLSCIKKGTLIFIDDGSIWLKVVRPGAKKLAAEVLIAKELKERKGINIPGAPLRFTGLTEKDRADLLFGIEHGVDYIAQSFVHTKEDVLLVRGIVNNKLPRCRIIAKIENRDGLKNLDEILSVSDGVMIARGDLGISLPLYTVPVIQKQMIRRCYLSERFVITATQMLESMVQNFSPTRAEVSDVANAIFDGTDYVMLSAETAVGKYPVEAVRMMQKIIDFTEHSSSFIPLV